MKLLYLLNDFSIGGAEKGVLSLSRFGLFEGFEIELIALLEGNKTLRQELEKEPTFRGSITSLVSQEKMSLPALCLAFVKLIKILWHSKPDILICSLEQANLLGRAAALLTCRPYTISFEHSIRYSRSLYYPLLKQTSRWVNGVFYDCETTRAAMQTTLFKRTQEHWVVPLASLPNTPHKNNYTAHSPIKIVSVGRLDPVKNYLHSITAIQILQKRGYNVVLTIIGIGKQQNELIQHAAHLKISNSIHFLGYQEKWTTRCEDIDIFLHASLYEGLSMSTIEAMGCALPIAATPVGEIQHYGNTGNMALISNFTADAIADAIEPLLLSEEKRRAFGRQARIDIQTQFSEERVREIFTKVRQEIQEKADHHAQKKRTATKAARQSFRQPN